MAMPEAKYKAQVSFLTTDAQKETVSEIAKDRAPISDASIWREICALGFAAYEKGERASV